MNNKRIESFMRFFIKLILLASIFTFGLFNYKLISINGGFKIASTNANIESNSYKLLSYLQGIYYYKNPFSDDYIVILETDTALAIYTMTEPELQTVMIFQVFDSNLEPKAIGVVPWYIFLIAGIIVLLIPFGRKKKNPPS